MGQYIATAFVFSGQRDPVWEVSNETMKRLRDLWEILKPFVSSKPSAPPLGYKGCALMHGKGLEYFAYGGVITRRKKNEVESRKDDNRSFEKLLLESAPKNLLPKDLINI